MPAVYFRTSRNLGKMGTVLIVDDDPSHLKLYSWIVERGGFRSLTALVQNDIVEIPDKEPIDVAVLDYRLGNKLSAADVARQLRTLYPAIPILILSDMLWMPEDAASYASGFIRKGEPQQLIDMISAAINSPSDGRT
jgi:DNA-binding NtrC family response regulator